MMKCTNTIVIISLTFIIFKSSNEQTQNELIQPKSGISKRIEGNFYIMPDDLRRFYGILLEYSKKLPFKNDLIFYVKLSNDHFFETQDIDIILTEPNFKDKEIDVLEISIRNIDENEINITPWKPYTLASVEFNKKAKYGFLGASTFINISSSDRTWTVMLTDALVTQLERCISEKKYIPTWLLIVVSISISFLIYLLFYKIKQISYFNSTKFLAISIALIVSILFFESMFGQCLVIKPYFIWGGAEEQYLNKISTANNIYWVIFIGLLVSIVGNVATYILFSPKSKDNAKTNTHNQDKEIS